MATQPGWAMLAYRFPREPSTPRIALWRRLRQIGAVQLCDGVVMLPDTPRASEHLEWLAADVREAGGAASVWIARPTSPAVHDELAHRMATDVAMEYSRVEEQALRLSVEPLAARRKALVRFRRELARIGRRDYFPPPERERAIAAVERLTIDDGARTVKGCVP